MNICKNYYIQEFAQKKKHEQKPNKKIWQFHENVIGGRNITIHLQK
jgi:hypothetical protein